MRAHEKSFGQPIMMYIETDEKDSPSVTRTEYEQLRELTRKLQAQKEPPDVVLSLPMFERMLRMLAVSLMHAEH